jgi:hypothetical protein
VCFDEDALGVRDVQEGLAGVDYVDGVVGEREALCEIADEEVEVGVLGLWEGGAGLLDDVG